MSWPTRAALCAESEVHLSALSNALAGRRGLPEDSFDRLCATLGVDPDDLRGIDTPGLVEHLTRLERQVRSLKADLQRLVQEVAA